MEREHNCVFENSSFSICWRNQTGEHSFASRFINSEHFHNDFCECKKRATLLWLLSEIRRAVIANDQKLRGLTKTYSLESLEARSPKSRRLSRDCTPYRNSREPFVSGLFQLPVAANVLGLGSHHSRCCLCPQCFPRWGSNRCPPLIRTLGIVFRTHLDNPN